VRSSRGAFKNKFPRQFNTLIGSSTADCSLAQSLLSNRSNANKREEEVMAKQILVPMKRDDRVEDFIPYVENVARPGMKVVFMVPYPVEGLCWTTEQFGRNAIKEAKRLASYYTWDANLRKAKDRISAALKVLPVNGIEVAVDLYTGSMRSAVHDYAAKGDVHLIVTRAGIGDWIARLFDGTNSVFKWFKRPSFSPVMLINPRALV
jgi:hypothetical protein